MAGPKSLRLALIEASTSFLYFSAYSDSRLRQASVVTLWPHSTCLSNTSCENILLVNKLVGQLLDEFEVLFLFLESAVNASCNSAPL
jgi:hypothetical protein